MIRTYAPSLNTLKFSLSCIPVVLPAEFEGRMGTGDLDSLEDGSFPVRSRDTAPTSPQRGGAEFAGPENYGPKSQG